MKNALDWLTAGVANWLLGAAIVALAGGWLYDGVSSRAQIATLEDVLTKTAKEVNTSNERLGICQANYRSIELALDRQGADIRDLASKSATATAEAQRRLAEIALATKAAREASQRVLARPLPTPDTACAEAAILLRGAM